MLSIYDDCFDKIFRTIVNTSHSIVDSTTLNPEEKKGFHFEGDDEKKPQKNYKWVELLARVFGIDVLKCPCGGEYKPLGAIKDPQQIGRYLKHVGLPHLPPSRAPPRSRALLLDFNQDIHDNGVPVIYHD